MTFFFNRIIDSQGLSLQIGKSPTKHFIQRRGGRTRYLIRHISIVPVISKVFEQIMVFLTVVACEIGRNRYFAGMDKWTGSRCYNGMMGN